MGSLGRLERLYWLYLENRGKVRAVVSVLGGFVLWEIVSRTVLTNRMILVPFSTVMITMWDLGWSGELWKHVSASLAEFVVGFSLAMVAGIFVGFLTGTSKRAREYLEPLISALYATPLAATAGADNTDKFLRVDVEIDLIKHRNLTAIAALVSFP